MNRRLYRCTHDRKIAGVASGVAEYFELDPTLVRILWFVSIFFGGLGLLLYIGMAIIVPNEPFAPAPVGPATVGADGEPAPGAPVAESVIQYDGHRHATRGGDGRWTTFLGFGLILFGAIALLDAFLPAWDDAYRYLVPAFIIGIGVLLVANALRRAPTEERESVET
jgi:phage shock protein PspC (stress-responsive transcriptional regulator)